MQHHTSILIQASVGILVDGTGHTVLTLRRVLHAKFAPFQQGTPAVQRPLSEQSLNSMTIESPKFMSADWVYSILWIMQPSLSTRRNSDATQVIPHHVSALAPKLPDGADPAFDTA